MELHEQFPHRGKITVTEKPDFVVSTAERTYGVEVTSYYRSHSAGDSPIQEQESLQDRVASKAHSLYLEMDGPPIHVSIRFNSSYRICKAQVMVLARAAVEIVRKKLPNINQTAEVTDDWDDEDCFSEVFDRVDVDRLTCDESNWSASRATWPPDLAPEEIQKILNKKNSLCREYRTRCDEIWLLIEIDGFQLASMVLSHESVVHHRYISQFDRVFILHDNAKLIELKHTGVNDSVI